jgi:probable RNA-binding protein EIF1AD
MSGLGRRTHYRKHLTDSVLNDLPEPNPPHSRLAKIVSTRGSNQFDVQLAIRSAAASSRSDATCKNASELAILPTKFRKLVWLKRNDYVIVATSVPEENTNVDDGKGKDDPVPDVVVEAAAAAAVTGGVRCMITHILYQDQIKHLLAKGLWPVDDPDFQVDDRKVHGKEAITTHEDGIVYDDEYNNNNNNNESYPSSPGEDDPDGLGDLAAANDDDDDALLFVNTNRIANLTIQDSSSDEEE